MKKVQHSPQGVENPHYSIFQKALDAIKGTVQQASVAANIAAGTDILLALREYGLNDPRTQRLLMVYDEGIKRLKSYEEAAGVNPAEEIRTRLTGEAGLLELSLDSQTAQTPLRLSAAQQKRDTPNSTYDSGIRYSASAGENISLKIILKGCNLTWKQKLAAMGYINKKTDEDPILGKNSRHQSRGHIYSNIPEVVERINAILSSKEFQEYAGIVSVVTKPSERVPKSRLESLSAHTQSTRIGAKGKYVTQKDIVRAVLPGSDYRIISASGYIGKLLRTGDKDLNDCFKNHGSFYEVIPGKETLAKSIVAEKLKDYTLPEVRSTKKSSSSQSSTNHTPIVDSSDFKFDTRLSIIEMAKRLDIHPEFAKQHDDVLGPMNFQGGVRRYDPENIKRLYSLWCSEEGSRFKSENPDWLDFVKAIKG